MEEIVNKARNLQYSIEQRAKKRIKIISSSPNKRAIFAFIVFFNVIAFNYQFFQGGLDEIMHLFFGVAILTLLSFWLLPVS